MVLEGMPALEELSKFNSAASASREGGGRDGGADGRSGASDLGTLMAALPADGGGAPKAKFAKGDKVRTPYFCV